MGDAIIADMSARAMWLLVLASLPALGAALVIGLVIGLIQAATSINEATLSFVPKLVGVGLVLVVLAGFIGGLFTDYMAEVAAAIPQLVR
jgi:flagellar biosynthetic protein FliQ